MMKIIEAKYEIKFKEKPLINIKTLSLRRLLFYTVWALKDLYNGTTLLFIYIMIVNDNQFFIKIVLMALSD